MTTMTDEEVLEHFRKSYIKFSGIPRRYLVIPIDIVVEEDESL